MEGALSSQHEWDRVVIDHARSVRNLQHGSLAERPHFASSPDLEAGLGDGLDWGRISVGGFGQYLSDG